MATNPRVLPATLSSSVGTIKVNVISHQFTLNLQNQIAQVRKGLASYPIKASQGQLTFVIQARSEIEYAGIQQYIRKTHLAALDSASPVVRFFWSSQGMDYEGFIVNSPGGNQRFNFAPTISVTMLLSRDLINTDAGVFSQASDWTAIYGTQISIGGLAGTDDDSVFSANPPTAPTAQQDPSRTGNTPANTNPSQADIDAALQKMWTEGS